jgi:hypothetical protein
VLIRADSPDEAYAKAMNRGSERESSYSNPEGRLVKATFRGLGYLDVVHDDLEDGAELLYERKTTVPEEEIQKWVLNREQLPLFRDSQSSSDHPDYGSKDMLEEAKTVIQSGFKNQV